MDNNITNNRSCQLNEDISKLCEIHEAFKAMKSFGATAMDYFDITIRMDAFLQNFDCYEKKTQRNGNGSEFDFYIATVGGTRFMAYSPLRWPDE